MFEAPNKHSTILSRLATIIPVVMILVSLACSRPDRASPTVTPANDPSPQTPAQPSPTPTRRALPPALVEATPLPGAEIPLNSLITLFFNQPMDRASVEGALKVHSFLVSDLVWSDDATLTINPGQDFPPGAQLGVQLDTQARAANGLGLNEPINLTYQTAGYLDLAQRLPEPGAQDVNPTSAIVAAFDHPITPLGADPATLPNPLQIVPPAEGRGEWVNTSTFIFYPQPGLAGGQTYTIQVDPTVHGIDGNPLQAQKPWTFTTAAPRVETVKRDGGDLPAGLEPWLTFTFNQPMDTASAEANFTVLDPDGTQVPGSFKWNQASTEFTWQSRQVLQRDTRYNFILDGQAKATGGTPLGVAYQENFQTIPELGVVATHPVQGGSINQYEPVTIQFSGAILADHPTEFINVEPRLPGLSAYYYADDSSDSSIAGHKLAITGWFDPATDYTLTVSPDLSDPWGSKLGGDSQQPFKLNFHTAPLQPGVMVGNGYGIHFLTPQDNALTAQVSGTTSLPISVSALPLEDFLKMESSDGYEFRRNYLINGPNQWTQPIRTDPNRTQSAEIYLSPDHSPLEPGLYFMRLVSPDSKSGDQTQLIVVSNTHLTLKVGATDALVWAVDLKSGMPVAGAPITIYDQGRQIASGQTDEQGIFTASFAARTEPYSSAVAILGQPGDENFSAGISSWNSQISPWNFNLPADFNGPRQEVYLYSDRPIYRPGQTVYYRGVLREAFNGRYSIPAQDSVFVQLNDDNGQTIASQELPVSPYGTIHGQFDLPANLRPANYSLAVPDSNYSYLAIPVADYRKPEIDLSVTFPQAEVLAGQDLQATVNARYFFDAPAGNVPLAWTLTAYPDDFDLPGYTTGLQGARPWSSYPFRPYGQQIASGEGTTLPDGSAQLEISAASLNSIDLAAGISTGQRQRYQLEVTAQDESGLPVSARADLHVNPAKYYIGVHPNSWAGKAGEPLGFDILTAGWDGKPAPNQSLRAEFSSVSWEPDPSGDINPYWGTTAYVPVYSAIASTDLTSGADGKARLEFTPPDPGVYQLDIYSIPTQSAKGAAKTSLVAWVGGAGQFTLPATNDRHTELSLDQASYKPGDTAHLFIPNPFPNPAQALVTIERGVVLDHRIITLQPGGTTIDLPLTTDDAPNIFISATLLATSQAGILSPGAALPDFRQGYINLPVEPLAQTLNVQITRNPEKTSPGGKVDLEIQVSDETGQPVQGEFSLAVVDLAALALADPNSIAIVPRYYDQQPLGIQTGVPLTAYAAWKYEQAKGGMGGGGGDGGPAPQVREKFPDTAYWQADIVTGPDGKAAVSLDLPDSLTTWQIETRGLTKDTLVGQAQSEVVTTQDLLIRPVTPRFLVAGDHLELAAVVQNNTDQTLLAEAALQTDGVTLDDPAASRQTISLPPNGRQRLSWWGTVLDQPAADLIFSVATQDGAMQDASRPALGRLPILRYTAPQAYRTAGMLDEAGQRLELVSLPRFVDPAAPQGSGLQIELAPSLAAAMLQALDVLEHDDCECTEPVVSRLLANIETYRIFQENNLFDALSPKTTPERFEEAIQADLLTLLNRQFPDGGWGWWPATSNYFGELHSDPFLTSYALFALAQAQDLISASSSQPDSPQTGHAADSTLNTLSAPIAQSITRAVDYLGQNLTTSPLPTATADLDRLAFALFALSSAGQGNLDALQSTYTARARLGPWGRAALASGLQLTAPGDPAAKTLLSDLAASAVRSATGAHWELAENQGANMTSTLANSAIVAYALAHSDPQSPLLTDAARYLVANRQPSGAWDSTYTTAWTLLAIEQIARATQELAGDFSFSTTLNDLPLAEGQATQLATSSETVPLTRLYPDSPNLLAIERSAGPGRLYYTAQLDVSRPADQAEPLSQGLSLSREYIHADCADENCTPIDAAETNQKVTVRLTLNLPADVYYLRLEDFIPAGAEILDTRLKTSQQATGNDPQAAKYDPANPYAQGWGWWNFHEASIYDDHIAWAADYLPKGTYMLTYSFIPLQAGEFQVLPARAWESYFPEVQATTAGNLFTIR